MLNYKVGVWINLNRENKFADNLRGDCNLLATWIASALEETNDNTSSYLLAADECRKNIWMLIDKYIEEEEQMIKSIISGKKYKS